MSYNNTWFIGCTHFGHESMYKFVKPNGEKVRPFANAEEGDAIMIERWNSRVSKGDKVYVLGDVAFTPKAIETMRILNGTKVLIKGNHDKLPLSVYQKYFKDVRSDTKIADIMLSHIPIHPQSLYRHRSGLWFVNVHAHLHGRPVLEDDDGSLDAEYRPEAKPDIRYFSVCVEMIDYAPISLAEIYERSEGLKYLAKISSEKNKLSQSQSIENKDD